MTQQPRPTPPIQHHFAGAGILLTVVLMLGSCAWFRGALHTAADAAQVLCELWAQEQGGEPVLKLSPKDFCAIEENIRPFIDAALAAKRDAGGTVGTRLRLAPRGSP